MFVIIYLFITMGILSSIIISSIPSLRCIAILCNTAQTQITAMDVSNLTDSTLRRQGNLLIQMPNTHSTIFRVLI